MTFTAKSLRYLIIVLAVAIAGAGIFVATNAHAGGGDYPKVADITPTSVKLRVDYPKAPCYLYRTGQSLCDVQVQQLDKLDPQKWDELTTAQCVGYEKAQYDVHKCESNIDRLDTIGTSYRARFIVRGDLPDPPPYFISDWTYFGKDR